MAGETDEEREERFAGYDAYYNEGMQRGVDELSSLTFSGWDMFWQSLSTGTAIVGSAASFVNEDGPLAQGFEKYENGVEKYEKIAGLREKSLIVRFLNKCWKKIEKALKKKKWFQRAMELFDTKFGQFVLAIRNILLSPTVLEKLIPFYGDIRQAVGGIEKAIESYNLGKVLTRFEDMKLSLGDGFPTSAMSAMQTYVSRERGRIAIGAFYDMAKSLASALATVFSFGVSNTVSFVEGVVSTISSFVYTLVQAKLFDDAAKKLKVYSDKRILPTPTEFKEILEHCPLMGCAFFALSPVIGWLTLLDCFPKRGGTAKTAKNVDVFGSEAKLSETANEARKFLQSAGFKIVYRNKSKNPHIEDLLKFSETAQSIGSRMSDLRFDVRGFREKNGYGKKQKKRRARSAKKRVPENA